MPTETRVASDRPRQYLPFLLLALTAMTAIRIYLSANLDLFGDEAFYRWESHLLAWSYSDLPPMTALAMKLGVAVGGDSTLALRSVFLLSATALPFAVYFLAYPVVGRNQALAAGSLSLLLPPFSILGILAIPDSLLLTECTLALACVERACRLEQLRWWLLAGVLGALGFLTHYRFVFLPFAVVMAFLCFPLLRVQLTKPGPWLAAGGASLGLIPLAIFNLGHDFGAIGFHFSERHPWAFHAEGLQYGLKQVGLVSPLLYGLLVWVLWQTLKQARSRPPAWALFGSVGLFYTVGLILLAPWVDQTSTTEHWAWFGYVPLLVFAPEAFLSLIRRGPAGRTLAVAAIALAALFTTLTLVFMWAPLKYDQLPDSIGEKLSVKMVGWDELRQELAPLYQPGETIYTTDYYIAAQLQQRPFTASSVRVIDHEKLHRDGRALQLELWQASERFMPRDGSNGLIVVDYKGADRFGIYRQIDQLCRNFQRIEPLAQFNHFGDRRRYGVYRAYGAGNNPGYAEPAGEGFCFPDLIGRVDSYKKFEQPQSGTVRFNGYLLAQPEGIAEMVVRVGEHTFKGQYGTQRPDMEVLLGDEVIDPLYPAVGFRGRIDTTTLANGRYDMAFVGITQQGREQVFRRYTLTVEN